MQTSLPSGKRTSMPPRLCWAAPRTSMQGPTPAPLRPRPSAARGGGSRTLRWQTAVGDAGRYSGITACASDGIAVTRTTFYELTEDGMKSLEQYARPAASAVVWAIIRDVTRRLRRIDGLIEEELTRRAAGRALGVTRVAK